MDKLNVSVFLVRFGSILEWEFFCFKTISSNLWTISLFSQHIWISHWFKQTARVLAYVYKSTTVYSLHINQLHTSQGDCHTISKHSVTVCHHMQSDPFMYVPLNHLSHGMLAMPAKLANYLPADSNESQSTNDKVFCKFSGSLYKTLHEIFCSHYLTCWCTNWFTVHIQMYLSFFSALSCRGDFSQLLLTFEICIQKAQCYIKEHSARQ